LNTDLLSLFRVDLEFKRTEPIQATNEPSSSSS